MRCASTWGCRGRRTRASRRVRLVLGAPGRHARLRVPGAGGPGRGARDPDRRGPSGSGEVLHPVQEAFCAPARCSAGSARRGSWSRPPICSRARPEPTDRRRSAEALSGNLCRCTGYGRSGRGDAQAVGGCPCRGPNPARTYAAPHRRGIGAVALGRSSSAAIGGGVRRIRRHPQGPGEFAYSSDLGAAGCCRVTPCAARTPRRAIGGIDTVDARHRHARRARRAHAPPTSPGPQALGLEIADQPVLRHRRACATSASRWRSWPPTHPETGAPGRRGAVNSSARPRDRSRRRGRSRRTADATHPAAATVRQVTIRHGDPERHGRGRRRRATTRSACRTRPSWARSRAWPSRRGRRDRPLHRHPVAARGPGPGAPLPGPARRADAAAPGRRRRGVRRPRGPLDAGARLRCSPCTPGGR